MSDGLMCDHVRSSESAHPCIFDVLIMRVEAKCRVFEVMCMVCIYNRTVFYY